MRKNIFYLITIAIIILFAGCSNEPLFDDQSGKGLLPRTERTISLTASIPDDNPTTRVALTQDGDLTVSLSWEEGDELQLVFVQDDIKIKEKVTVGEISEDGKNAKFNISIPSEITANFDLYGVYGGGGLSEADPTMAVLPTKAGEAGTLTSIEEKEHVMFYFASKNMEVAYSEPTVIFNNIGSLFSIKLKNTGTTSLEGIAEARLVGVGEDNNWAYNIGDGGGNFDLITGEFQNIETAGNYISFKVEQSSLSDGEFINLWSWYPPLPGKVWPELKLYLLNASGEEIAVSENSMEARTEETAAGMSYYFFADWDGSNLNFTDQLFTKELSVEVTTMGTLGTILTDNEKANITRLILTGKINKADFEVMKTEMPNLSYIDMKDVTCEDDRIPDEAFGGSSHANSNKVISTVILPDNIKTIGEMAFARVNAIESLTLPDGLLTIEKNAFSNNGGIKSVNIPDGLENLGYQAFRNCTSLEGVIKIPDGITTIGMATFYACRALTGIILPNDLATIQRQAFVNCTGITEKIVLPATLASVEIEVFSGCENVEAFRFSRTDPIEFTDKMFPDGANVEVPNEALATYQAAWTGVNINLTGYGEAPEGFLVHVETMGTLSTLLDADQKATIDKLIVTGELNKADFDVMKLEMPSLIYVDLKNVTCEDDKIPDEAFGEYRGSHQPNKTITTIILPKSIKTIGVKAFAGCTGLTGSLDIPSTVTTIEGWAFYSCSNLSGSLILPDGLTTIGERAFQVAKKETFTGSLTIPNGVTRIEKNSFNGCLGFNGTLTLPAELEDIDDFAFLNCQFTGTLIIPDKTTSIGTRAFDKDTGTPGLTVTSLLMGSSVETIGNNAFANCSTITGTINFPASLSSLGVGAFENATGADVFSFANSTPISYNSNMIPDGANVKVPNAALGDYQAATGWSVFNITGY